MHPYQAFITLGKIFDSYFPSMLSMDSTCITMMPALGGDFGGYSQTRRQDAGCAKVACGKLLQDLLKIVSIFYVFQHIK